MIIVYLQSDRWWTSTAWPAGWTCPRSSWPPQSPPGSRHAAARWWWGRTEVTLRKEGEKNDTKLVQGEPAVAEGMFNLSPTPRREISFRNEFCQKFQQHHGHERLNWLRLLINGWMVRAIANGRPPCHDRKFFEWDQLIAWDQNLFLQPKIVIRLK